MNAIVNKTGSLIVIFKLLEKYMSINRSEILAKSILNLRTMIEKSSFILIPNNDFWIRTRSVSPPEIKAKLVIYDNINIYETEQKLEKYLVHQFKERYTN